MPTKKISDTSDAPVQDMPVAAAKAPSADDFVGQPVVPAQSSDQPPVIQSESEEASVEDKEVIATQPDAGSRNEVQVDQQPMQPRTSFTPHTFQQRNFRPVHNDISNPAALQGPTEEVKGILDIQMEGHGFLRPKFVPSNKDIYISQSQIRRFMLRGGDLVEGIARPPKDTERYYGL